MLSKKAPLVLDTHVWVWLIEGDPRAELLKSHLGRFFICAISVWEIGMLVQKGRLELAPDANTWVTSYLKPPFYLEPLSASVSLRAADIPEFHGDPADRTIVATALEIGAPLVTADRKIQEWFSKKPELENLILPL